VKRGLWFVTGAGAGVYAMVRGRRAAEALTADGLRDRWRGVALGVRMFRHEVAQGSAEKETELRERYGLVPHGTPELETGRHRAVVSRGSAGSTADTGHETEHDTRRHDREGST
jgi:hypothetical protein